MLKKWFIKLIISGTLAFTVLSVLCFFYYNIPSHKTCEDGSTDYIWEDNKSYFIATEGLSFGHTNNEGYFNENDYNGENVDILIMGSSHMQGMSVNMDKNVTHLLHDMTRLNVYNIGTTGHSFKTCISNFEKALLKYGPKMVVIETDKIELSKLDIENVINNRIEELPSIETGIKAILQKNPFIRWSYSQVQSFLNTNNDSISYDNINSFDYDETNRLIEYIADISKKYESKVIIVYHPAVFINEDGSMMTDCNESSSILFNEICTNNGLFYIDMSKKYVEEYDNNLVIPSGFANTLPASGHINENGHRMFAEEIIKKVEEIK